MKLKYILTVLALTLCLFVSSAGAQQTSDGEKLARGLLNKKVSYYRGEVYFTATTNNNSWQVYQEFTMVKSSGGRWAISQMTVNGNSIYIDPSQPLPSLPSYTAGDVTNYQLYMTGYDEQGGGVRYGYAYAQHLLPEDPIKVTIYPYSILKKVPYQAPPGTNPNDLMIQVGESNGYYYNGYFYLYMDWRSDETAYQIIDRVRNVVIGSGNFNGGNIVQDLAQTLELVNDYGIREIDLDIPGGYQYLPGQRPTTTLFRNDDKIIGNVYTVFTVNKHQYLHVYIHGAKPANQLEIWGYSAETDEFTLLANNKTDQWGDVQTLNCYGFDRYKVVMLDNSGVSSEYGFGINIFTSSNRQFIGSSTQ